MPALVYVRLIGFAAGTLLHLFLVVLVAGYRRARAFERVLFFVALALFLFYSGALLGLNSQLYYEAPPPATIAFAVALMAVGLGLLPPLLVHVHAAYAETIPGFRPRPWLRPLLVAFYLPALYFGFFEAPRLFGAVPLAFLEPGSRVGHSYGAWLGAALGISFLFHLLLTGRITNPLERGLHRVLMVFFAAAAVLVIYTYALGGPLSGAWSDILGSAVILSALVPSSLLGYYVLRFNFLEIGSQRNLIYAVSAAFLALLYLGVVRRVGGWLEGVLPPEATAAILLFVLVVFFEPLQRRVGRALRRTFRVEVDRLQRLTAEMQQQARQGDLVGLLALIGTRICQEFSLGAVRIRLHEHAGDEESKMEAGTWRRYALRQGGTEIGVLEVTPLGSAVSGETAAALEFLADQLPAMIDLCRLIEEKLKLERKLGERERMALVGQMAASVTHNLKNPLGSMKTVLQVQIENPRLPEDVRQDCAMVVGEIDRLSAKLNQLLRYAKPAVRTGGSVQKVGAVAAARQLAALLGRDAERRGVKLELVCEEQETYVRGSDEALNDVLSNLVVNAIETLQPGGNVAIRLARQDAKLLIEIIDDGAGIPAQHRARIFQPFFTTKPNGTGLGLAIVERRVSEMGGTIRWESPAVGGRGTRFQITLPVIP